MGSCQANCCARDDIPCQLSGVHALRPKCRAHITQHVALTTCCLPTIKVFNVFKYLRSNRIYTASGLCFCVGSSPENTLKMGFFTVW